MLRRLFAACLFAILLALGSTAAADDGQSAQAIVDRTLSRDAFGWEGAQAKVRMVLTNNKGEQRTNAMEVWARRIDKRLQTLVRFRAPQEVAGTSFLLLEQQGPSEQYIYLPGLKRTRRVVGRERKGSFVGSDFTYADFERQDVKASSHKRLPDETISGIATFVIESTPKGESAYSKIQTWIRHDNYLPLRIKFFDGGGAIVKTMYTRRIQKVDGEPVIFEARMQNEQTGHATDLVVEDIKKLIKPPDSMFTPTALEHE
jgi:outer membrane lipoprotein-sorting protein